MTKHEAKPGNPSIRSMEDSLRDPEALKRARFQNLIWRQEKARSAHLVGGSSGGPDVPRPDVPVEWLKELDHR